MLQLTNPRLLFRFPNSSPSILSLLSKSRPLPFFTVYCSSSRRQRSINLIRRGNCSLRETKNRDIEEKGLVMEETECVGFNKRRAEGRDKSDKPKSLQLKSRKLNPINTICYVQILGTGMDTQDTSPSVLLFFDKQRFIFNAGEGLQRYCTEHKIKPSKIDHIFLSRVCSETAGGLPGLLLTLAGIGEIGMSINIWGPSDLNYLVNAMRSFIPKAAMVHAHSFGSLPGADGVGIPDQRRFTDLVVLINDEVVKISAILLRPGQLEGSYSKEESTLLNSSEMGLSESDQFSESPSPQSSNSKAEPLKSGDISVIYVCELPEIQGKFDPEKAKALGLKPGPKYRELQLGNSVKSDHQNIMVHPSDVLGPSTPGPIVLLVDCPTASHMQELLSIQSLTSYYTDSSGCGKFVNCIIHLTPTCVTSTPDYQKWMKRFGGAQHIMAGHEMKNAEAPILQSSVRISTRLNYLCPQFFPTPGLWSLQHPNYLKPDSIAPSEGTLSELCESISAQNLLKFHLRPYTQLGLDRSGVPALTASSEIIDTLLSEIPEITDAADQVSQFWHRSKETKKEIIPKQDEENMIEEPWLNGTTVPSCLESITREDMEIVLLGTGSSQPSKYRNVSSIYINLFSKGSLLFDCGEGTLGQLKRRFGLEGADDAVRALRLIWISHIHADHHTGLARILALRRSLLKGMPHDPLLVIGPGPLKKFLNAYQRLEDLNMQFLDCRQTTEASLAAFERNCEQNNFENVNQANSGGPLTQNIDLFAEGSVMQSYWNRSGSPNNAAVYPVMKNLEKVLGDAGLEALMSVPVMHCPQAFGVVLKASERINSAGKVIPGWKIAYSGDTRPCPELIEASRGATVLIHEATFEEGMEEEAIGKNHSTTKEAIEVGTSAGAYRIILTHFSQRYPKIPVFDETHMHKTCIAFDLMSINLADLPMLPKVLPYLKLLFKNEVEVEEELDDAAATENAAAT